jgi:hypothetical protein
MKMSDTDIKEVVKEKYGQAALRVMHLSSVHLFSVHLRSDHRKHSRFLKKPCWPRWAAGILPPWQS